jgi:signal transduction histidine kinase
MPRKIFHEMWKTIKSWKIWRWIVKNQKKDWWYYWVRSVITPVFDEENKIVEYISTRTDITELIDSIIELNNYKNAFDSSEYFLKLNNEWKVYHINKNFLNALWYKKEELVWKNLLKYFIWENIKWYARKELEKIEDEICKIFIIDLKEEKDIAKTLKSWEIWKWVIKNKTKLWHYIWCKVAIIPIYDSNKNLKEFIVVLSDITDLEIAKQKLKTSFRELKKLDEKKSEFLNIASHELRTPITSINWYLSMIIDGDMWEVNNEIKHYLEKVLSTSKRLLDLVNDMLDIAKLESWKTQYDKKSFFINELIRSIVEETKPILNSKKQNLILNIDKTQDIEIFNDKNKIRQCIINLLSNAIKFTKEEWEIKVITLIQDKKVRITICDNWIWIKKEDLKIIFEKFGQIKNSLTRDIKWTWLWLPIVKWIITDLWGNIYVESEENIWSCFTITLPI